MTFRIPGWIKIVGGLRGRLAVGAFLIPFSALLPCSAAHAEPACTAEALLGWWALQTTNTVVAGPPGESFYSPFVRASGSGSASTTFVDLREDGSAVIEERFIRGHRASDITLLRSENNTWSVDTDCQLEITGLLTDGYSMESPHRLHGKISPDNGRFQGMREVEDQQSGLKLIYAITGDHL